MRGRRRRGFRRGVPGLPRLLRVRAARGVARVPAVSHAYNRLKGCPRVPDDEEEDGVDDIEGEFGLHGGRGDADDPQLVAESVLRVQMSYGRGGDAQPFGAVPNVPLLTNGQMVDDIPPEQHALVPSYMGGGGGGGGSKRIHPLPCADPSHPVQPRSMDSSKDLAAYGYGSVAWKERMEGWKQKQERLQQLRNEGGGDWDGDDADLPLMDEARQPLSRKVPIPSSKINPYRMIIFIRSLLLCIFWRNGRLRLTISWRKYLGNSCGGSKGGGEEIIGQNGCSTSST